MNILSLIQNQLSPQAVSQISNTVGESAEGTKSALGTAFPALLGSLLGKANASPSGITDIFNLLKQGQGQGGWPDSIANMTGGLSGAAPQAVHQSLLSSLLGSKLGPVSDIIANQSGIRGTSATSLLSMAAPLLMGTLGKQITSQGLGASGLAQLLGSQAQHLKDALPPGLANTLGIGHLLSPAQGTPPIAGVKPPETAYREAVPPAGNFLKWAWVPVLLALLVWFLASRTHRPAGMGGTFDTNASAVMTGGENRTPNLSNLNLTPGGTADDLAKAITSGDWNKTIAVQGFSPGSGETMSDSARAGIREVGTVLAATPGVKVRITGHGETDEAGLNQANTIKSALMSSGVSGDRVSTTGQSGSGAPSISLER